MSKIKRVAARGQTVGRHFQDEADAFIRYLKLTIRNIMHVVNFKMVYLCVFARGVSFGLNLGKAVSRCACHLQRLAVQYEVVGKTGQANVFELDDMSSSPKARTCPRTPKACRATPAHVKVRGLGGGILEVEFSRLHSALRGQCQNTPPEIKSFLWACEENIGPVRIPLNA
jgi:hypothetical protein